VGGVGGLIGGALARARHEVLLIVRPDAVATYPRQLRVESELLGDFEAGVDIAAGLDRPVDVLWVTVKATQLEAALEAVPPERLGKGPGGGTLVVPLLNGIDHVAVLCSRYGDGSVLPGAIRVESERFGPGHIVQPSPFLAVELGARPESRAAAEGLARELVEAGITCQVTDGEATTLWRKLAILAPLALTTTGLGAPVGEVQADPEWRERLIGCGRETSQVGIAEGAEIDPERTVKALLATPAPMRTSMQKDAAAGRPLELDAIAGPILRLGRRHGIDVPFTEELVAIVESHQT
jgi:2-dehydropantoate 2-reductase